MKEFDEQKIIQTSFQKKKVFIFGSRWNILVVVWNIQKTTWVSILCSRPKLGKLTVLRWNFLNKSSISVRKKIFDER